MQALPTDEAVRLHLAPLTPRRRAALARGERDAEGALATVTERAVRDERERCERLGIRIVTAGDPRWPPLLREIPDPPLALWVRGTLPEPESVPLALVGPRRPTAYGIAMAERLAHDLARVGALIVSGGAAGVDAAAHRAALSVPAPTVAVLGCGVDVTYPPGHGPLFREIVERGGALVSELPCGAPPLQHHFPIRNRILAGWCRSVLVVEATEKSGSLITARLGLTFNRDVLAVPGPVTSPCSAGTNELIAQGAKVLRCAQDAWAEMRDEEKALLRIPQHEPAEAADGDPILLALGDGLARSIEELVEETGSGVGSVLARLVALEAEGRATCLEGGLWMRLRGRR